MYILSCKMILLGIFALFSVTIATPVAMIKASLNAGLCLCIEENDVYARTAPGGDNPIAGVLRKGHCLISKGGLLHKDDVTWYEVKMVDGTGIWIDSNDLRAVFMSVCTNPTTTALPTTTTTAAAATTKTTTPFDPFAGGLDFCFTDDGLISEGQQARQNGVLCTCHAGNMVC